MATVDRCVHGEVPKFCPVCIVKRGVKTIEGLTYQLTEALAENDRLSAEVDRLKAGKWTKEEINDICHNLHGTVNAEKFAAACAEEQRKIYGCAPEEDARKKLAAYVSGRVDELNQTVDRLKAIIRNSEPEEWYDSGLLNCAFCSDVTKEGLHAETCPWDRLRKGLPI